MLIDEIYHKAKQLRKDMFNVTLTNGGHLASSLSCIDILVALYYGGILKFKSDIDYINDTFILSKGHAETALYSILADFKFFPKSWLNERYRKNDCFLGGHPDITIPGVTVTSGSLGHGLGISAGMALASKMNKINNHHFVLLGDTECTEGSVWEAALFASKHKLNNLIAIIDYNNISALDYTDNFTLLEPFAGKWSSFNFDVRIVNGHDLQELISVFTRLKTSKNINPQIVIAKTIKGKGISFLENNPKWHTHSFIDNDLIKLALTELE